MKRERTYSQRLKMSNTQYDRLCNQSLRRMRIARATHGRRFDEKMEEKKFNYYNTILIRQALSERFLTRKQKREIWLES